jgi:hypothetical protein
MKGMRFDAVSSIQQIVTGELQALREEAFSRAFDSLYKRCNRCAEAEGGTVLSAGYNKYFLSFLCGFYGPRLGT